MMHPSYAGFLIDSINIILIFTNFFQTMQADDDDDKKRQVNNYYSITLINHSSYLIVVQLVDMICSMIGWDNVGTFGSAGMTMMKVTKLS